MAILIPNLVPIPYIVAGKNAEDPTGLPLNALTGVISYIQSHTKTVEYYDGIAALPRPITSAQIDAASHIRAQFHRHPILPSATFSRVAWFQSRNQAAPWVSLVGVDFANADPNVVGGPYDDILNVWYTFADSREQIDSAGSLIIIGKRQKSYAGNTQINKVLYLLGANVFPIFDGVLQKGYNSLQASSKAAILRQRGGINIHGDAFSWEPFRKDLTTNQNMRVFSTLRHDLASLPPLPPTNGSPISLSGSTNVYQWVAEYMSDLRLMDILAWSYFKA